MKDCEVVWTLSAQDELEIIYQYYSLKSEIVANKIISSIFSRAKQLQEFPLSGQEEEFLKKTNKEHRYIVEGNYKIIYRISGSVVYISDVFDTRQNPQKIVRNK